MSYKEEITWHGIGHACEKLAEQIKASGIEFQSIWAIPRGGLIPGVVLSHKLGLPLTDKPDLDSPLLIVDDISDTGETLQGLDFLENAKHATIHYHRNSLVEPDFWVWEKEEKWIVYPWEIKETESVKNHTNVDLGTT